MDEISSFGYWLRRRRKTLDITQEMLARQVGCAVATIKKIEADERRPSRAMAERLAECLAIPPAERQAFLRAARAELAAHRLASSLLSESLRPVPEGIGTTASPPNHPLHNLSTPVSSFIGRAAEIAKVCSLLQRDVRLVTLTGPGGIGKTRLALQVANELLISISGGIWFVDLAAIHTATLVIPTIAQTFDVRERADQSLRASLKAYLRARQILLVIDNFEQVIDAAPDLAELLAAAPNLKLLVTSRAVLHLSGEYEFAVPPLNLPEKKAPTDLVKLAQCESVQLLVERTRASRTDFALTGENVETIMQICLRLEGMPLAIELAAARCKLFTPQDLLKRLEHRLRILTVGTRDLPTRQQTLRATIEWSYQLLRPEEQRLFARLGVFVGGFTLEAVEAVCQVNHDHAVEVIEGITTLLDQSLLRPAARPQGEQRFMMLETLREYASEQLLAQGEEALLREQHATYFLVMAEQARPLLLTAQQQVWYERLIIEQENFRAALNWWRATNQYAQVAQLGGALYWFWWKHGDTREHVGRLEWALAALDQNRATTPIPVRAKALLSLAVCVLSLDDFARARRLLEEYLKLEPQSDSFLDSYEVLGYLGDIILWEGNIQQAKFLQEKRLALSRAHAFTNGIADSLMAIGELTLSQGDYLKANQILEESLALRREVGTLTGIAATLLALSQVNRELGNFQRAELLLAEALHLSQALGDNQSIAWVMCEFGVVALLKHELEKAKHALLVTLALQREVDFQLGVAVALVKLGNVAVAQADFEQAHSLYRESLALCQGLGYIQGLIMGIEGLAVIAAVEGQPTQAAQFLGSVVVRRETMGIVPSTDEARNYEQATSAACTALGEATFRTAFAVGRAIRLEDIIVSALDLSTTQ